MEKTCAYLGLAVVLCFGLTRSLAPFDRAGNWSAYGSDKANTKYAPFDQINRKNVGDLQIVWRWSSIDNPILEEHRDLYTWKNEATPLMIDGVLYTSTSLSQVAAIDAESGTTIWAYDPESYRSGVPPNFGFVHRGVAYWEAGEERRILIGTGDAYLRALDAKTGLPVLSFGDRGKIDLTQGLRRPVDRTLYGVSSPPVVCRDVVIVGASILDQGPLVKEMPPGDIRGFDVRTGKLRWVFHSIPQEGEVGNDTWMDSSWTYTGNTNVWSLMSCDEALGYVYLPFGTPSNDHYGGHRPGENLFAESLVALKAETGERVWHYQMVHHGVWDYDLPAAPNLLDIEVGGRKIQAVAQVTKQGFAFVFDRRTGEPVWPIEERVVPQSTVPGERTSSTQPFPAKPLPFERQGVTPEDLIDFTPALRQAALAILEQYDHGPLFTPPSERGTLTLPGIAGGASWAGAAAHPGRGMLYVPSVTLPFILQLTASDPAYAGYRYTGTRTIPLVQQYLPLIKPPYGRVTAIDLNTGEHLWVRPVGNGPRQTPALRHLDLPPLGWPFRSFPLLTESLLFIAQEGLTLYRGYAPGGNAVEAASIVVDPYLRALDPVDGTLIAEIPIPGNATGTPITYMAGGRQYIVIPIGGASQPAELIALRLP